MAQVVEYLLSKGEAPSSNPYTDKKKMLKINEQINHWNQKAWKEWPKFLKSGKNIRKTEVSEENSFSSFVNLFSNIGKYWFISKNQNKFG
jgi:hypothetical protein